MGNLHYAAFRTEMFPDTRIEGRLKSDTFDIQLQRAKWTQPGEGVFTPPWSFIELIMVGTSLEASYRGRADGGYTERLGEVAFIPPGKSLQCRWVPHDQRALSIMFDLEALSARGGVEWDWTRLDPDAALNIRNPYIEMALRRIAEEVVTPTFASGPLIECSLMFITHELDTQFNRFLRAQPTEHGKLSARQQTILQERLSGDLGEGLSVADLAQACGCTTRQLSELYRNTNGETLRTGIARARLERAKRLLMDRDVLIKQVASLTGFRTPTAFAAAFREATGCTPTEFQEAAGRNRLTFVPN
jgi:AraC family transcriptional regulator